MPVLGLLLPCFVVLGTRSPLGPPLSYWSVVVPAPRSGCAVGSTPSVVVFPKLPGWLVEGERLPALAGLVFDPFNVPSAPPPFPHSLPPLRPRSPPSSPPLGVCWCAAVGLPPFRACCLGGPLGGDSQCFDGGGEGSPPPPPGPWSAPWWPQAPRGVAEPQGKVEVSLALGISNIECYKENVQVGLAGWDPWSLHVAYLGSGEVTL